MAFKPEDITEEIKNAEGDGYKRRNQLVAVFISILAVLLAVAALGGSNATKDMINNNIEASNYWAFFQAKNIRQTSVSLAADELTVLVATRPDMPPEVKKQVQDVIAKHRATVARYESDPQAGDGKKEIAAKAKRHEEVRNKAQAKDPYFDYSQAFLQIAIVLASVSLVTGSTILLFVSYGLSVLGIFLLVNAYTLLVHIGFLE